MPWILTNENDLRKTGIEKETERFSILKVGTGSHQVSMSTEKTKQGEQQRGRSEK